MEQVFAIHDEFGRFFDEVIYKRELAARMPEVLLEVAVDVTHGTFTKRYLADAIVCGSGLFEFKAADAIHPKHRSQTIHYLLLFGLAHAKVINVRTEQVQHEFVNCLSELHHLRAPRMDAAALIPKTPGAAIFRDTLAALIQDWGGGLELSLYEEALTHFLGGDAVVISRVPVLGTGGHLAEQTMRLAAPEVAFKLTAFPETPERYEAFIVHARRLLRHASLKAIHWANITHHHVQFTTIQ
jgi:GxxExxY protein